MTYEENRKALVDIVSRLTRALSDCDQGFVYVAEDDAARLKTALESYLSGEASSLEKAFGLVRGRGAPKRGPLPKNAAKVRKVMQRKDKTLEDMEFETGTGTRHLLRLVARHKDHYAQSEARIKADQLVRLRNEKLAAERKKRLSALNSKT